MIVGLATAAFGPFAFFLPQAFYDMIPGLSMMGPFNIHFIRDVGLALLASGACMFWGGLTQHRAVAICGSIWPFLHALFHVQVWAGRGFPFDYIMGFDALVVMLPAFAGFVAALRLKPRE